MLPFLACALCLLAAKSAVAEDASDLFAPELGAEERLQTLLQRTRDAQASMSSFRASFVQHKESRLLLAPEESRGSFSFLAPARVRWEFVEPDKTTVLLTEEEMLTWYRDLGTAERLHGDARTGRMLQVIGAAQGLDRLRRYFDLSAAFPKDPEQPIRLLLSPRSNRVRKRVQEMEIWLHREHYVPIYVRYVEAAGDVTELRFTDLEINVELPESYFEIDLPPEVEVREVSDRP
jgi:outer membrane lipoprotein-sorting protein